MKALQLTPLASGRLKRLLPPKVRENERTAARAAGQLPAQNAPHRTRDLRRDFAGIIYPEGYRDGVRPLSGMSGVQQGRRKESFSEHLRTGPGTSGEYPSSDKRNGV